MKRNFYIYPILLTGILIVSSGCYTTFRGSDNLAIQEQSYSLNSKSVPAPKQDQNTSEQELSDGGVYYYDEKFDATYMVSQEEFETLIQFDQDEKELKDAISDFDILQYIEEQMLIDRQNQLLSEGIYYRDYKTAKWYYYTLGRYLYLEGYIQSPTDYIGFKEALIEIPQSAEYSPTLYRYLHGYTGVMGKTYRVFSIAPKVPAYFYVAGHWVSNPRRFDYILNDRCRDFIDPGLILMCNSPYLTNIEQEPEHEIGNFQDYQGNPNKVNGSILGSIYNDNMRYSDHLNSHREEVETIQTYLSSAGTITEIRNRNGIKDRSALRGLHRTNSGNEVLSSTRYRSQFSGIRNRSSSVNIGSGINRGSTAVKSSGSSRTGSGGTRTDTGRTGSKKD